MVITTTQRDILARLNVDVSTGLSTSEASSRRRRTGSIGSNGGGGGANIVRPPINCPKWICCLLPCIGRAPSMRRFRLVQPDDAELLRDSNWVRYDHGGVVIGDVLRLVEGDVVPADCLVIGLGMGRIDDTSVANDDDDDDDDDDEDDSDVLANNAGGVDGGGRGGGGTRDDYYDRDHDDDDDEITVDARLVTGECRPTRIRRRRNGTVGGCDGGGGLTILYYGSRVLSGSCVAVAIATGERVTLSKLIRAGRWPPSMDLSEEVREMARMENENATTVPL
ncbi:hypothetical protein ACHAXA_008416 [Cyclostephanos tholiformis]|uniref:P-type ATPase A domain-containing protein n=1 Tax=Cyclostephanos tholiformis TaxID=382380 RepID=A0ABD3SBI0_9STRA